MKEENALVIFAKNLVYGKVKTRLAATVGKDKAFEIYKDLLAHTATVSRLLSCTKIVYYSDAIETDDVWDQEYKKARQEGPDLGERMKNAFQDVFAQGYSKAVIIGTDCPQLNEEIIEDAFDQLSHNDIIIGPASDGGYYLLGMKLAHHQLFKNIAWSTPAVLDATKNICDQLGLKYSLLPLLNDVDEEKDLNYSLIV